MECENEKVAIQCALLHDVLEDTIYTYADIVEEFGENVADGVYALTKDRHLPKDKQIEDSLQRIGNLSWNIRVEIQYVKLADRLVNLSFPRIGWSEGRIQQY